MIKPDAAARLSAGVLAAEAINRAQGSAKVWDGDPEGARSYLIALRLQAALARLNATIALSRARREARRLP
jgi:hypothetical protein